MQYRYLGKSPESKASSSANDKLAEQFEVWTLNALREYTEKTADVSTAAMWFGSSEEQLLSRFAKYDMTPNSLKDAKDKNR